MPGQTSDCGPHCKPPSPRHPYGKCCKCKQCHGKPSKRRWQSGDHRRMQAGYVFLRVRVQAVVEVPVPVR